MRSVAADLAEMRADPGLHEFRWAMPGSGTPKLPSSRRLARAAAVLEEAAACLQVRFDDRTPDPDEGDG